MGLACRGQAYMRYPAAARNPQSLQRSPTSSRIGAACTSPRSKRPLPVEGAPWFLPRFAPATFLQGRPMPRFFCPFVPRRLHCASRFGLPKVRPQIRTPSPTCGSGCRLSGRAKPVAAADPGCWPAVPWATIMEANEAILPGANAASMGQDSVCSACRCCCWGCLQVPISSLKGVSAMADKAHTDDREFPRPSKAARRRGMEEAEAVLARWAGDGARLEQGERPLAAPTNKRAAPPAPMLA